MTSMFRREKSALVCRLGTETVRIEPWGPNALRCRARAQGEPIDPPWNQLLPPPKTQAKIEIGEKRASITVGKIRAEARLQHRYGADVKHEIVIRYLEARTGRELLAEARSHFAGPAPRAYKGKASDSFSAQLQFAAQDGERFYGMGQHQHGFLDLKGASITLLQQNTHVVVPFLLSSRGYGFVWHNPAVGKAEFARNVTRWTAEETRQIDYWITAGDDPAEIVRRYIDRTGHAMDFPEWASGFWQCKLRYRTQSELLSVAREYKKRGLPISCIVIDFFHWTRHGEWKFDPSEWPDPRAMVRELESLGIKTMVSIWPTVSVMAEGYAEMRDKGYLMKTERGAAVVSVYPDKNPLGTYYLTYYDATNPEARAHVWRQCLENYVSHGIDNFWMDSCEPEIRPNHPENVRLAMGTGSEVLNAYPTLHLQGFREGLTAAGKGSDAIMLTRSHWLGAQRYGSILWSGDVWSTWRDFRAQIAAGLNAGIAGQAWWTTDIGGFFDGIGKDPAFRELLVRWFQFGVFSPVCRLHGVRIPDDLPLPADGIPTYGVDTFKIWTSTGGANEIWSYGKEVYEILKDLLFLREKIRPLIMKLMRRHKETGDPVMRPLFYDFPKDPLAWAVEDAYLLGPDVLVAPVLEPGAKSREVYLPEGTDWVDAWTGAAHRGGRKITVPTPLAAVPVFLRAGVRFDWAQGAPSAKRRRSDANLRR